MSTCMCDISPVYMMSYLCIWCLTCVFDVSPLCMMSGYWR